MRFKKANRLVHKWLSIVVAIPLLVVFVTGILLLTKKQLDFIQPPTARGQGSEPTISFRQILSTANSVTQAQISDWSDVDRLDVRPSKGIVKIRSKNSIEIQIDSQTGTILHVAKRRSDLIESIHDGTFFEKRANLWLMLPVATVAIIMSITGIIMFMIPYLSKKRRPRRRIEPQ
ncbi:MAG: PepSY domain-containing protein [Gammaproteobacteria bacterium]|nr:PepSY domain-containing protein [Gammaproteobacteria bacterium]